MRDSTAVKYTKRVPKEDDVVKWGGLKRTDEFDPDGEKKPPAVENPPSKFVTALSLLTSPSDDKNTLADIPVFPQASSTPQALSVDHLGLAMKTEMLERASPSSSNTRDSIQSITLSPSSDDDEEIVFTPPRIIISQPRIGNHHGIYGYSYACKYLWTAHMGKNGPHTNEMVYSKDFNGKVWSSIVERNRRGAEAWNDMSLLCVQLDIYGMHIMRDQRQNRAKVIRLSNNGAYINFQMFSRFLTKKEIKEGKNCEAEMLKWLEKIRQAYLATKAQYPLKLEMGGVLGKHRAHVRPLDTYMMDNDVADIARLIYPKKIADGTMLDDAKRVNQFFSPWNAEAARDLLS